MVDNRCKIERTTCAENFLFFFFFENFQFFKTCRHFAVYSDVNDPPIDLNVWGQLGQRLAHSRCSVNVTGRMNEGQVLTRQKQPGKLGGPGEGPS